MSRMTPRFSSFCRWPSRFSVICLAFSAIQALAQSPMNVPADGIQIHYVPALPDGHKHNNTDPSLGWILAKVGGTQVALTSSVSANATFTFFGDSIQVFASAIPTGDSFASTVFSLDNNQTIVAQPTPDGLLYSATSLNAALPHTITFRKSQLSSDDSVIVISAISVVGFSNVASSSASMDPLPTMTTQSTAAGISGSSSGLPSDIIAAIAVSVVLVLLMLGALFLFLRRRRRRLPHQVNPLIIDPPKRPRRPPLSHIRTRLPHYRAPPSINPPSSPGTTAAHHPRALEGIQEQDMENAVPDVYSTLPPLSILRPSTPPPPPSPAPTKRRSLFVANPSLISSFSFSSGKSRSRVVPVEKGDYREEKQKPVIDIDPPPLPAAVQPSRSLRRFFTTNPGPSAYATSSTSSASSRKSKRNRSRSNSNTSSVPQIEDTAPPAPLLITQPQSPGLSIVEEEVTQMKQTRTSRPVFYTANPSESTEANLGERSEGRHTYEVKGPRPNKGKKKASS
ncbi:hypothetical protein SCHPADRAFT_932835 [Schizopora paradoxa]|uniref:Transmembrane protein n=1 Tax=Schizopora paradoxa TaxID=27342 RepID=A0A0H2RPT3_9AGAM|nr:hypothetical protein SCHPADRAFT_932835 [Schizopora paradoxa]